MTNWPMARILGQQSFLLETPMVELAVTMTGAMVGPVTFFPRDPVPIRPYAVAPWAEEALPGELPPMLAALRGDWFCSAFGGNAEPHSGRQLPPHGETANRRWSFVEGAHSSAGCWLQLATELPLQGGRCSALTALCSDHSVIYQRHDLSELTGPLNPGHHATLQFPDLEGAGHLSFSPVVHAHTYVEPTERPSARGYSFLKPNVCVDDLHAAPCIDGSRSDLCRYPARRGFEDIVILCTDPAVQLGWSAVTFPTSGIVWFALRDPRQLTCTLLWCSNGGRHYPPWNGRHVNVMGIEDVTAFFHEGLAASIRHNLLSERGIRTALEPDADGRLSVCYIQGVARIPGDFDRVKTIETAPGSRAVLLRAHSGVSISVPCESDFLRTGLLHSLVVPQVA
jgi:hypothetical protein